MENQKISVELLSRLCRTCAIEHSHISPLFARESDVSFRLDDMLMSCTNMKILEADGFPNSICDRCVDELKFAYGFQQRCEIADRYYKQLRLKSTSDCTETETVYNKRPNYDYIEMLENDLIVFRCRECCQAFSTIRELKNHKQIHSKNEITEEKRESLNVTEPVVFTEGENEEDHLLEMKQEEIGGGSYKDSNSSFVKKINKCDIEEYSEMNAKPMESEIKEEELLTFVGIAIKGKKEDNGTDECNVSNLFFEQSYQKDTKELEVVAIQKEIEKESLLEVMKETNARSDNNIKSSSSDIRDEDYSPSSESDSDYFPDQTHRINIGTKNPKHRSTRRQHRLVTKLNSPKTDCSRIFQCADCGQKFNDRTALQDHCLLHSCRKEIGKEGLLEVMKETDAHSNNNVEHRNTSRQHRLPKKRFKCDVCEKSFTYTSSFTKHKLTHNINKRFKCDVCEKSFVSISNFRRHQLTHNTKKPYKCDMCEKSFSCSSYLRQHAHIHNKKKRFKCDVCDKLFTFGCNLRKHQLTHNASKPFKCDMCEKSFSCSRNLQLHKWTHDPNKCFKCDVCDKSFAYSSSLTIHKLSHSPTKRFKCDVCDKLFAYSSGLGKHELTHNANKQTL